MGVANGAWFNARARMPVPMVAVNQFGVNWRTTPSKRQAAGGRVDVEAMAMVMENAPMDLALLSGRKAALAWRGEDPRLRIILPIDDFDQFDLDLRLIAPRPTSRGMPWPRRGCSVGPPSLRRTFATKKSVRVTLYSTR